MIETTPVDGIAYHHDELGDEDNMSDVNEKIGELRLREGLADARDIAWGLEYLRRVQAPRLKICGDDNIDRETIVRYALSLVVEAAEVANELPWKTWKKARTEEETRERVLDEFADLLHFVGTWMELFRMMNIDIKDVVKAFERKSAINTERLAGRVQGYGVEK